MKTRLNPRILFLAIATFAVGTDAYVIAGILPEIAHDLHVQVDQAGQMVTLFAMAYALGAPILAVLTARVARRWLLIIVLIGLCLANILSALATTFGWMLLTRVVAAACAALCSPTALAIAAMLAPPEQRGKALASVNFGLTIATVLGVPLGTLIGSHFGWMWTFGLVALLAGGAALALVFSLPAIPTPPVASLRARISPLGQGSVLLGLCLTFLWALAGFTVYTYITPLLRENVHLGDVSGLLLIYGVASMVGNWVGGYAVDRWGAFRSILVSLVLLALIFLTLPFTTHIFFGAAIVLVVWGIAAWSLYPAQQHRLLALAPGHSSVILALNGSVLYLGIAAGAGIGGLVLAYTSVSMLGVVAGVAEALALGTLLLSAVRSSASVAPLSPPVEERAEANSLR
ncbi:MAG: MFS transporter [Chloroflexi bacterium]|nr:MFS transporter [Chloroflexota bacterium]